VYSLPSIPGVQMLGKIDACTSLIEEEKRAIKGQLGVEVDNNISVFSRMKNIHQDITHYSMHYPRTSERRDSTYILFKNPKLQGMYLTASAHSSTANNIGRIKFFFQSANQFYVLLMVLHWNTMESPFLIQSIGLFAVSNTSSLEVMVLPLYSILQITSLFPMDYKGNKIWISVPHLSYY
jgi:hypothetical protein